MAPTRPTLYSAFSVTTCLPLASLVALAVRQAAHIGDLSPSRRVTSFSRRWWASAPAISCPTKPSSRGRASISVTRVPSAANIEAYSQPITPAPITVSVRGMRSSLRIPSLVKIAQSSMIHVLGPGRVCAGGDHDVRGAQVLRAGAVRHRQCQRMRVDEAGGGAYQIHAAAVHLRLDHVHLVLDHVSASNVATL